MAKLKWFCFDLALKLALYTYKKKKKKKKPKSSHNTVCVTCKAKWRGQVSLVSVRKLASRKRVGGEKRVAVKPLLNVQCPPMSLEKVWQAILRQFWRYVRPRVNPKDGFDFNEILWSFLDQSRRWGQELRTWSPFSVSLATLYRRFPAAKGLHRRCRLPRFSAKIVDPKRWKKNSREQYMMFQSLAPPRLILRPHPPPPTHVSRA